MANGKKHGRGSLRHTNQDQYYGEFKDGLTNGYGAYIKVDEQRYEGFWLNDQKHGYG